MGGSGKGLLSLLNGLHSNLSKAETRRFNLSEFTVAQPHSSHPEEADVGSRHEAVEAVRAQGYSMSL